MRGPGALAAAAAAALLLAVLVISASAQPRIAGRFASLREACEHVDDIATACKHTPPALMDELSDPTSTYTLFYGNELASSRAVELLGPELAQRVYSNKRIAVKYVYSRVIRNRLLTACTLNALSRSRPLVLAAKLPLSTLTFKAVTDTDWSCNYTVQGVAPTGNTYIIGKALLHTLQAPFITGPIVPDIMALAAAQTSVNAWSTVSAATTGLVSRMTAVFARPATGVPCPTPELVARAISAHPELTACITMAAKGCANGWGTSATVLCSHDVAYAETLTALSSDAELSTAVGTVPLEQAQASHQLYIPGQRLSLADLPKVSSLTAKAGNTIDVSCADGSCSVRTSPGTPAVVLVQEVPLGDGIMMLAATSCLWPKANALGLI